MIHSKIKKTFFINFDFLFWVGVILIPAPYYPPVKLLMKRFYLFDESLWFLGGALVLGGVCARILPFQITRDLNRFFLWMNSKSSLIFIVALPTVLVALYLVNRFVLMSFMNSGDEYSCLFLAQCIQNGKLWARSPELYDFFSVTHVGNQAGKWFSVYPPGWPLLLAFALTLQLENWINPLLTIFALSFFCRIGKQLYGTGATLFAMFAMATSSFFLMNGASYFSHSTSFLMISIFVYSYLKWCITRTSFWALICAFSLGYGLGTRYLTVAALAAPFLIYEFIQLVKSKGKLWNRSYAIFSVILMFMLYLNLHFNLLITGNYFDAPNHYHHRWERLGFHSDYTVIDAALAFINRFFFLSHWIAPLLIVIYLMGLVTKQPKSSHEMLFRFGFLYIAVSYVFYYSWGGNQYGPRYFFEGFPFMALFVGKCVTDWWSNGRSNVRPFLIGALFTSLLANIFFSVERFSLWRTASSERKALYVAAERDTKKPAIVFIHGFLGDRLVMSEQDAIRNHPELNTPIIYAHDLGSQNTMLGKQFPKHFTYLGVYDRSEKRARITELKI